MGRRFDVKPPRVRSASCELHEYSRQTVQISYEILEVSRRLSGMSGMGVVCAALRHIADDAQGEAHLLEKLSDAGGRISSLYDRTENNITINGEKSRQKFPIHRIAVWSFSGRENPLFGIKILG